MRRCGEGGFERERTALWKTDLGCFSKKRKAKGSEVVQGESMKKKGPLVERDTRMRAVKKKRKKFLRCAAGQNSGSCQKSPDQG